MKYVHIKNLEEYNPGYKDRGLIWFKFYFKMVQGDPEFELIESEIDKWRYVSLIALELQSKKPLPVSDAYFCRKGFDLRKRSMSLTLKMLHGFIEYVTEDSKPCTVEKIREDKEKIKSSVKTKYGEFKNVLLTEIECDKLDKKFGFGGANVRIDNLDFKIEQKGYKYKSHYLTILDWDRRDEKKNPKQKKISGYLYECPNCQKLYEKPDRRDYHYRCEENKCQEIQRSGGEKLGIILEYKEGIYKE